MRLIFQNIHASMASRNTQSNRPRALSAIQGICELTYRQFRYTSRIGSRIHPHSLTCSFSSHHTWLHNLLSWAINNSASLTAPVHAWSPCCSLNLYGSTWHNLLGEWTGTLNTGKQNSSSIQWTHPGSFGIFTKLNTSMCAADCSQGYKFNIYFTPAPLSHTVFGGEE